MYSGIFAILCKILISFFSSIFYIILVALVILVERKLLALSQRRLGPSILGKHGFLQIVADVIKPLFKERYLIKLVLSISLSFIIYLYFTAQVYFSLLFCWLGCLKLYEVVENCILIQFILTGLCSIFILYLGFGSRSKYSFIGSIRLIFSELANDSTNIMILSLLFGMHGSLCFESMILLQSFFIILFISLVFFFILLINVYIAAQRSPIDLIENEGELVAGYNIEYSSSDQLLIYFAEYFHLFNAAFQFSYLYLNCIYLFIEYFCLLSISIECVQDYYILCIEMDTLDYFRFGPILLRSFKIHSFFIFEHYFFATAYSYLSILYRVTLLDLLT